MLLPLTGAIVAVVASPTVAEQDPLVMVPDAAFAAGIFIALNKDATNERVTKTRKKTGMTERRPFMTAFTLIPPGQAG